LIPTIISIGPSAPHNTTKWASLSSASRGWKATHTKQALTSLLAYETSEANKTKTANKQASKQANRAMKQTNKQNKQNKRNRQTSKRSKQADR
jgi:hypothetical protein